MMMIQINSFFLNVECLLESYLYLDQQEVGRSLKIEYKPGEHLDVKIREGYISFRLTLNSNKSKKKKRKGFSLN